MTGRSLPQHSCGHGFIKASCADCKLKNLCLPIAMDIRDIDRLDRIIQRGRPLPAGAHLYREGDAFSSVFAVRSGSTKSYIMDERGAEQITGFYLPGEIFGFDGIGSGSHGNSVVAMETSSVCEIPFSRLEELSRHIPALQHHFFQVMGRQIETDHKMMMTLGRKNAEGRLATLLVSLLQRNSRRNLSSHALRLSMSRSDIGNFLGLTIETVSRTFSRLQKDGVVEVDGREINVLDHARLNELCRSRQ